jgi:hypothetical protein
MFRHFWMEQEAEALEILCHEEMGEEDDDAQDHEQQHAGTIVFPEHTLVESTLALSEVF